MFLPSVRIAFEILYPFQIKFKKIFLKKETSLIVGGGSLFAIHNESEVYNPRTDRWAPIPSMGIRRSRSGVASLGKVLYVIGG